MANTIHETTCVKASKRLEVCINAASPSVSLKRPLCAINWFNAKSKAFYNFYAMLASPIAQKAGAKMLFKGYLKQRLEGDSKYGRQVLMVVKYPSASHFLQLVSNKIFQLISIIRIVNVKQFVFGFARKITLPKAASTDQNMANGKKENVHLVHHFQTDNNIEETLQTLSDTLEALEINVIFAGSKAATIGRKDPNGMKQVPFFMDGLLVLEASKKEGFGQLLHHKAYQAFKATMSNNFIALFDRVK